MLKIAVDDRDIFGAGRENALDHRAGEAQPIDPPDASHPGILGGQGEGDVGGAVGRIVVDDDHLPRVVAQNGLQPLKQLRNVRRFAIGRHDHR